MMGIIYINKYSKITAQKCNTNTGDYFGTLKH